MARLNRCVGVLRPYAGLLVAVPVLYVVLALATGAEAQNEGPFVRAYIVGSAVTAPGDASAANQTTMIGYLGNIDAAMTTVTTAGSPLMVISDNTDNDDEHAVCTSDCTIFSVTAFNHTAASAFLRCENDTAANTTPGSETASANELDLEIPASTTGSGFHLNFGGGIAYSTALTCWIVSDEAATGTTDVAQNDVRVLWNRVQQ